MRLQGYHEKWQYKSETLQFRHKKPDCGLKYFSNPTFF